MVARWYRDGVFRREMEVAAFLGELLLLVLLRSGACVTGGPRSSAGACQGWWGDATLGMGPGTPARQVRRSDGRGSELQIVRGETGERADGLPCALLHSSGHAPGVVGASTGLSLC